MVVKKDWGGGEGGVGVVWIVLRQSNGRNCLRFPWFVWTRQYDVWIGCSDRDVDCGLNYEA